MAAEDSSPIIKRAHLEEAFREAEQTLMAALHRRNELFDDLEKYKKIEILAEELGYDLKPKEKEE